MIKGGDLVDLGLRQTQQLRQGRQMRRAQLSVTVVDPVQVFDQQIVPPRRRPDQGRHLGLGVGQHGAASWPLALALLGGGLTRNRDQRFVHSDTLLHGSTSMVSGGYIFQSIEVAVFPHSDPARECWQRACRALAVRPRKRGLMSVAALALKSPSASYLTLRRRALRCVRRGDSPGQQPLSQSPPPLDPPPACWFVSQCLQPYWKV